MAGNSEPGTRDGSARSRAVLPQTAAGWWAFAASVFGLAVLLVIMPLVTQNFRETVPITDTWVMPAIGGLLVVVAAGLNVYAVGKKQERSWVSMAATVLTVLVGAMVVVTFVGGAITGQ